MTAVERYEHESETGVDGLVGEYGQLVQCWHTPVPVPHNSTEYVCLGRLAVQI